MSIYLTSLFALPASMFFALALRAPYKAVGIAALNGLAGQYIYVLLKQKTGDFIAVLAAALVIGIVAEVFSRLIKTPATVISYASLTPLVPGVMLYRAMLCFSQNEYSSGIEQLVNVLLYAGCMAIGISLSAIIAKKLIAPIMTGRNKPL